MGDKSRAVKLKEVIEQEEWHAASSPSAGDVHYDKQDKARVQLARLGYLFEWTGPYKGRLRRLKRPIIVQAGQTWARIAEENGFTDVRRE